MAAADLQKLQAQLAPFVDLVQARAPRAPSLTALRDRIEQLAPFLNGTVPAGSTGDSAQAARTAVAEALSQFFKDWKDEFVALLLGGLPELPGLRDALQQADWLSPDGFEAQSVLGPLTRRASITAVVVPLLTEGLTESKPLEALAGGPAPIEGLSASLAGPFPGDGGLRVLDDGFGGALRMPLGPVTVDALASLRRTPTGGLSFLGVLGVGFTPAIQFGLGFAMDRVSGIVGVERRLDLDALTQGIRNGWATEALSGAAGSDVNQRLATADRLFPSQSLT